MPREMDRRRFLVKGAAGLTGVAGLGLLDGCARHVAAAQATTAPAVGVTAGTAPWYDLPGPIVPIRADVDRIFRITVCLRPFRAAGPRLDTEWIGDKLVVHNYGHGGSGWSLSWGSADLVVRKAMTAYPGVRSVAIIGCGALGLTAALTAQRLGLNVTIYAKERPPYVRSARATGSWTPDSRIALASAAAPSFAETWEQMARTSFALYQSYLGASGTPIEWTDRYLLRDDNSSAEKSESSASYEKHTFARYRDRIADITPGGVDLPAGSTPFPTKYVRRSSSLTFNVASYSRQLLQEFLTAGGHIETREFHSPSEFASLPQNVLINCTGYGARQLWADESVVPVRGQIAWLVPQDNVNYGIFYRGLNVLARRDGIVIQPSGDRGDDTGWNDTNEQPDHTEAEAAVRTLQELYSRMHPETTQAKRA